MISIRIDHIELYHTIRALRKEIKKQGYGPDHPLSVFLEYLKIQKRDNFKGY